MNFEIDLSGKTALVTGGGHGVGETTSEMLASVGAKVLVNDYYADRAESVAGKIRATGATAEPLPFDVTDFDGVHQAVSGRGVDILVNNAGNAGTDSYTLNMFHESPRDEWDRFVGVNFFGPMNCIHACTPHMISAKWGRIITVVSDAGRRGEPRLAVYAASKAGAAGFTRAIARELGRYQITANNVALGTINTFDDPTASAEPTPDMQEAQKQRLRPYIIRRIGEPEDPAAMITFLASPLASWITGQTYPVNGGYTVNQ
ncbi:MAG: SDR family NAD(P)-dependent oxidoreductase [Acidimicrobiales bacterium]